MKHYETVTKQAEELLKELERDRASLSIEKVLIKARVGADILWPSIKEATLELCTMEGLYKCFMAIHEEAARGVPAPSELLKRRTKKDSTPDDLIDQLRKLPGAQIRELIYNLEVKSNESKRA